MFNKLSSLLPGVKDRSAEQKDFDREALELVQSRQREAQDFRGTRSAGMSLEAEWERGGHRFLGNFYTDSQTASGLSEGFRVVQGGDESNRGLKGIRRASMNRTQNSIIANTADQTQQPIQIRLEPAESGDADMWFLTKDGGKVLYDMLFAPLVVAQEEVAAAMAEAGMHNEDAEAARVTGEETIASLSGPINQIGLEIDHVYGEQGPSKPLTEAQAEMIRAQYVATGLLKDSDIITVDDKLVTQVAQKALDNRMDLAGAEQVFTMNELFCNIWGHQPLRFQWHEERPRKHQFTLENTHILNVWVDPTHSRPDDFDYLIFDHIMSADEAKSRWPELAAKIDSAADDGSVEDETYRHAGVFRNTKFQRPMVTIRTGYLRFQKVPMTPEEAVADGLVHELDGEMGKSYVMMSEDGEMRPVEPQQETNHGTDWPDTYGIRQIVCMPAEQLVVEDMRCPYWDMPFAWNVNIPRPDGSPYGQGEPVRLEDVSQQINRIMTILDSQLRSGQFPQRYWPQTVLARLKATGVPMHNRPNLNIPLPDDDYWKIIHNGGFGNMTQKPQPVADVWVNWLTLLLDQHDALSGNSGVRQGRAPFAGASGDLVEQLGQAAQGPLAFKSKFTEWMVQRVAYLALDAMVKWMPESEWGKIVNQYKIPVLREIISRISVNEWNITVEIATGRGANSQLDQQKNITMYREGLRSRATAIEKAGDSEPEAEITRLREEGVLPPEQTEQRAAELGAEAMMQPGVPQQGPQM